MALRIENAIVSYVKYIYKTIWPVDLAVFYPFPASIPLWKVAGATILLVSVSVMVISRLKSSPWLTVGWFWFIGTLFPVIGLVQGGLWPEMADRWAYVPQAGLFIMIAWPVSKFVKPRGTQGTLATLTAGILLIALAKSLELIFFGS